MAVKLHQTETTASAAIGDAYSILAELRDECQEAYESMPDSLQSGQRGETLSETVDALDGFCNEDPSGDLLEGYADIPCVYGANHRKSQSRSDRRDEAVRMLEAASYALAARIAEIEDDDDMDEDVQALQQVVQSVDKAADAASSVEFPGMYG